MVNSKVIAVTVRPEPKVTESQLEIELAHITNVSISRHARHMFQKGFSSVDWAIRQRANTALIGLIINL